MSSVLCIEVEFESEAIVEKEFSDLEKNFTQKTKGFVQQVKPKIFKKENKVVIEMDLKNGLVAKMMLPIIKMQLGDNLEKNLAEKGYKVKTRCYLK